MAEGVDPVPPDSSTHLSTLGSQLCDRVTVLPTRLEYAVLPPSQYEEIYRSAPRGEEPISDRSRALTTANGASSRREMVLGVDEHLVYARFFADFGPLDLAQTVRFCRDLTARLEAAASQTERKGSDPASPVVVVVVSSDHPHKRANAVTLLVLFLVILHRYHPVQAVQPFRQLRGLHGFRDAACGLCTFALTVLDCARAVHKAMMTAIWSYESFVLDEYEHLDQLQHGDINWIVPGKLLAFSGPQRERIVLDEQGATTLLAPDYAKLFQQLGVTCVIRFNEASTYDRRAFVHANIRHLDMEYPDGGNPPDEILHKFLRTCEREPGAIAVHCKAGLGRTGTNIAAFLMKNHRFTAVEAIAWCRICRPGSIVGPQQQYLVVKQAQLWAAMRVRSTGDAHRASQPGKKQQAITATSASIPKRLSFKALLSSNPPSARTPGPGPGPGPAVRRVIKKPGQSQNTLVLR